MIAVPEPIAGLPLIVSMSGGKDSTATALALKEAGLSYTMVFADTGWEAPETYAHLDHLRERIGPIDVVGADGGMLAIASKKAGFPMRMGRWCTEKLKIAPLRTYFDAAGPDVVSVLGIRSAESAARAKMPEVEDSEVWGGWVWRPLIAWTVRDVLDIHHRHGIEVNPLYKRGHDRVGCYPCVLASKEEVRLVAEYHPERIDQIREAEQAFTVERARRNASGEGKFKFPIATFFSSREASESITPIDNVVEWSRTERGGRQLPLLQPEPDGGCFRWGFCEAPALSAEEKARIDADNAEEDERHTRESEEVWGDRSTLSVSATKGGT